MTFAERLVGAWSAPRLTWLTALLLPLSWLFRAGVALRRALYRAGLLRVTALPVPVIVVGNITVGGAGKTPLVRALAAALSERGLCVGIVSRGHGGGDNAVPRPVAATDDPRAVGDEPLLLAAGPAPVFIGRDRVAAARALLAAHPDVKAIIADDGLQHYALGRRFEIAAIDATRGFGNGRLLPAGPLREPLARLREVDAIVRLAPAERAVVSPDGRESVMTYEPLPWVNLVDPGAVAAPGTWPPGSVHALAGIAHPQRFFDLVRTLGVAASEHPFPDHHPFAAADLAWPGAQTILMTEKDAVKCREFADARCWYLPVRARIDPALVERVLTTIGAP
jgi:tetraacyldisaccharide 4'-kinase